MLKVIVIECEELFCKTNIYSLKVILIIYKMNDNHKLRQLL